MADSVKIRLRHRCPIHRYFGPLAQLEEQFLFENSCHFQLHPLTSTSLDSPIAISLLLRSTTRNQTLKSSTLINSYLFFDRGASASCSPSPRKLKEITVTKIINPGKKARLGASQINSCALVSMFPQLGVGG